MHLPQLGVGVRSGVPRRPLHRGILAVGGPEASIAAFSMSRLTLLARRRWASCASACLLLTALSGTAAGLQLADGLEAEVVAVGIPRPVQVAIDGSGRLVILSHGSGAAAAELYRLDLGAGLPLPASRTPPVVIPFAAEPRKAAFGSLAVDPRSGDLFLGEENGNRIYRMNAEGRL